jgi:sulfonate transport system substrate-binding protein
MIRRRTMLAGLGTVLATPTLGRTGDLITIRFGFATVGVDNRQFSGGNFLAVAHADHYIDNELKDLPGVKVQYTFFKGAGPAVNEAFANDQLDFASQGDLPQIIGRASGLKTRQLAAGGSHAPLYLAVLPDSSIHTIEGLKGQEVALFRGTNNHLAAVNVLTANGMTERDFQGINMDEASAGAKRRSCSKHRGQPFARGRRVCRRELSRVAAWCRHGRFTRD